MARAPSCVWSMLEGARREASGRVRRHDSTSVDELWRIAMRAWVIRDFGKPNVFETREVPDRAPGPGEVKIRVHATSVNPVDFKLRRGDRPQLAPPEPRILHGDVAGVVEEVGEGVTRVGPGDEVWGCPCGYGPLPGVLADFAIADERLIAKRPASLSDREAAALPLVGLTAMEVFWKAPVGTGDLVLIHGGTGGVGHVALQIAKSRGARVAVTCGSETKAEIARKLGADEIILYRDEKTETYVERLTHGRGFDLVVDTHGGAVLDQSFRAAQTKGRDATNQASGTHELGPAHAR